MNKQLKEIVFVIEEAAEGGYIAKALGESIVTEADDLQTLRLQIVDAVHCHFMDEATRPQLIRLHHVKDEILAA